MSVRNIDINCDLGEGVGNEKDIMPYISSCNIACGGHAGNPSLMREVVGLAEEYGVAIGAHPSYPDRKNFGRMPLKLSPSELRETVNTQIADLIQITTQQGASLHHIKAHGALYNDLAANSALAETYLDALKPYSDLVLYVPYKSEIAAKAIEYGFSVWFEAFADRNYDDNSKLVSRKQPNALITNPEDVLYHVLRMANDKQVRTITGKLMEIEARTFCVHGDSPNALDIIKYLSHSLPAHNIQIAK